VFTSIFIVELPLLLLPPVCSPYEEMV